MAFLLGLRLGFMKDGVALGTPDFLELGPLDDIGVSATTSATIESSFDVTPPANTWCFVALYGRGGSNRTHDSVVSGFSTVDAWVKVEDVEVEEPGGTFHRLSLWKAKTTSSPGTGTVTGTASGTNFQRALAGFYVENASLIVDTASTVNTTGTTVAITFSPVAITGDAAFFVTVSRGDCSGTIAFDNTPTNASNSPAVQSTNFTIAAGLKVSPNSTITTSGASNNQAHLMVGALLRGGT